MEKQKTNKSKFRKFLFSELLIGKNTTHKIAYIAIFVALNVVVNTVGSIPLGFVQFSLTLFLSSLTGIMVGPLFGFSICFIGDTLGYFIGGGGGGSWTPWVGISMGIAAVLSATIIHLIPFKGKNWLYLKLFLICVATFFICTYAIGTPVAYYYWNMRGLGYKEFVIARISVQVWNNLINSLLLFVSVPLLNRIKPLQINL